MTPISGRVARPFALRAKYLGLLAAVVLLTEPWVFCASAEPSSMTAGTYALDPQTARLTAKIGFLGIGQFSASFRRLAGVFNYDPQRPDWGRLTIEVDPRSMDNPTSPFGRQMLAAFQPDRYPTITFVAQRLDLAQARQPLTGELTLRGVTRPFTLNVVFKGVSGDDRAAFTGTGRIRRSEFGITDKRGVVADRVDLAFEVEFVRRQVWP